MSACKETYTDLVTGGSERHFSNTGSPYWPHTYNRSRSELDSTRRRRAPEEKWLSPNLCVRQPDNKRRQHHIKQQTRTNSRPQFGGGPAVNVLREVALIPCLSSEIHPDNLVQHAPYLTLTNLPVSAPFFRAARSWWGANLVSTSG